MHRPYNPDPITNQSTMKETIRFVQSSSARIPTEDGNYTLCYYRNNLDGKEHLALMLGEVTGQKGVLVRVHSECFTGDVLGSLRCDCGSQLAAAMRAIGEAGRGVILYLRQEGRGIGLEAKLRAYNLQDQGYDTVDANLLLGHQADERDYQAAAHILRDLGIDSIRLMTNNPAKIEALQSLGIEIQGRVPLQTPAHGENIGYLTTKVERMHHLLDLAPNGAVPRPEHNGRAAGHPQIVHRTLFQDLRTRADQYWRRTHRAFVTLSYAQSLDGCIAAQPGQALAISSAQSLAWTHTLRANHDAILIGIGTALADDPSLTVRAAEGRQPVPVVVDSRLRLSPTAQLFQRHACVTIATTAGSDPERRWALAQAGATILTLPATESGRVDLASLFDLLAQEGTRSVMVEGGGRIITQIWRRNLANQAMITVAPILLGGFQSVHAPLYSPNGSGLHYPRLRDPQWFSAGGDTILWGEVA